MRTDNIVHLISQIRERANALIASELKRYGHPGLAPSHGAILVNLYEHGPLPMSVLAQKIGKKKNTVTVLVKKMEQAGYVRRSLSPSDSRVSLVSLTDKGQAFRQDFEKISKCLLSAIWTDMDQSLQESVVKGLNSILTNLS